MIAWARPFFSFPSFPPFPPLPRQPPAPPRRRQTAARFAAPDNLVSPFPPSPFFLFPARPGASQRQHGGPNQGQIGLRRKRQVAFLSRHASPALSLFSGVAPVRRPDGQGKRWAGHQFEPRFPFPPFFPLFSLLPNAGPGTTGSRYYWCTRIAAVPPPPFRLSFLLLVPGRQAEGRSPEKVDPARLPLPSPPPPLCSFLLSAAAASPPPLPFLFFFFFPFSFLPFFIRYAGGKSGDGHKLK